MKNSIYVLVIVFASLCLLLADNNLDKDVQDSLGSVDSMLFELRSGVDWKTKEQNIEKLAQKGEAVVPILIRCLRSELPEDLSKRIRESAKGKLLPMKADGSSFGVQECSEITLVRIGKPAVPNLIESIDKQPETVATVVAILGKIGDRRAIPAVISVLSSDHYNWWERAKAAESLEKLNAQQAIGYLIDALEGVPDDRYNNDKFLNYIADSLAKLSGETFGFMYVPENNTGSKAGIIPAHYVFIGTDEQKRETINKWRQWWQENKQQIGITEGNTIDNGFVFVDGKYIESPYVVSRRGLSLYINNIKIKRPARYAGMPVIPGYENPESLSLEEKQKLIRQLEATRDIYEKYLNRKYGYLFFSKGGHVRLSPHTAAYDLPEIVEILTSDKTRDEKLTKLLPHNWHLSGDMETFVDSFYITDQLLPRLHQLAEESLRVDEYGTTSGAPVEQGFVFIGGKYIDAPYHIERRGLGVFINGIMVVRPCWVPEVIFSGDTDPEMPKEINSESCLYDEVVRNYTSEKQTYLHKHSTTREKEAELMAQVYKNLPFVTKAVVDESRPHIIDIETNDGMRVSVGLNPLTRRVEYDKESVTKRVDSDRKYYHEALEKGKCFIMSARGGRHGLSTENLPKMIYILNSKKSPSEKYSEIHQAGIHIPDEELTELIANFSASPQLQLRIEKL